MKAPLQTKTLPRSTDELVVQYRRFRQVLLYGVIGASGALLDFCLYVVLTLVAGVAPWLATFVSTSLGACHSFFWNARINFGTRDRHMIRFASFYSISAIGVFATAAGVYGLHDMLGLGAIGAKVLVAIPVVLFQYLMNSTFTFADASGNR